MKFFEAFEPKAQAEYGDGALYFAIGSKEALAGALREFADSVERGDALIQSVKETTFARLEDYPLTMLRIAFTDSLLGTKRIEKEKDVIKALYAPGEQFPVDTALTGDDTVAPPVEL